MKLLRSEGGPFAQRPVYEIKEIDSMCLQALRESGFLPSAPAPIDIESFVSRHFSAPVIYRNLGEGILGCTRFDRRGRVVEVIIGDTEEESDAYERRIRSTIAHEAGHGLMHAFLFLDDANHSQFFDGNVDRKECRILCRTNDIKPARQRYNGKWWEWQANRAIGAFLLPLPLVRLSLADMVSKGEVTGVESLPADKHALATARLAETFEVNPIVAKIRIEELFPQKSQLTF